MNINDAFKSNYLKAGDLEGDTVFTIDHVAMEELGQGKQKETKAVVYFRETDKGLVVNVTNKNTIVGLYGADTDGWIGQTLTLFATEVEFAGEQVLAIRVRMKRPTAPVQTAKGNGAGAPAQDMTTVLRREAWEAFKAKNPGKAEADLIAPWRALMSEVVHGKKPSEFSGADWVRIKTRMNAETSPFEDETEPAFTDSDVPF
jgi:hypothetical protein